jgi:hypothetical protein
MFCRFVSYMLKVGGLSACGNNTLAIDGKMTTCARSTKSKKKKRKKKKRHKNRYTD